MKHLVVIPAYNESETIERLLRSLLNQSHQIDQIIVVDDGSTDDTGEKVTQLTSEYENMKLVSNSKKDPRATGAKIVKAFNLGLATANLNEFDVVSKFDADLEFPTNYIEVITRAFSADKSLGLCGGYCLVVTNQDDKNQELWEREKVAKDDHIRGALKSYRVTAFEEMKGLKLFMGWDSADEFHLRFNDWKVKQLVDLGVKHYRETNSINGWVKTARLNAEVFHNLGYGFVIGTLSSLKRCLSSKPIILNGVVTLFYYYIQYLQGKKSSLPTSLIQFVRKYRWNGIMK